jgi:hypothetical protein
VEFRLEIAKLFADAGDYEGASAELRAALPIINEEEMVPEGLAALSLLKDSLRGHHIDRKALRELQASLRRL